MQTVTTNPAVPERHDKYRQLRETIGTQAEVAKLLDVTRQCVQRREGRKSKVTREAMYALERLCQIAEREAKPNPAPKPPQPELHEIHDDRPTPDELASYAAFVEDLISSHGMFAVFRDSKLIAALDPERTVWTVQGCQNVALLALLARRYGDTIRGAFSRHFAGATFEITTPLESSIHAP